MGSKLNSLAVHPTGAKVVAAGMDDGLYLSRNSAESFDLDGQHLWFGSSYAGKAVLARITLKARAKAEEVSIPALTQDGLAYIAQNPARRAEIAIATFKRSVFVSKDLGRTWTQVAKEGVTHE